MRVLVACEESQAVCIAFREGGHQAFSCDLLPCSGGHPEWHIQGDAIEQCYLGTWDLIIGHPPCTYLTNAGIGYFNIEKWGDKAKERRRLRDEALEFFIKMYNSPVKKLCLENPVGWVNSQFRKPNQTIQPHYFGDHHLKRTCLWLRGLPRLNGTHAAALDKHHLKPEPRSVNVRKPSKYYHGGEAKKRYFSDYTGPGGAKTGKERSKTFPGIARAMAEQWGR